MPKTSAYMSFLICWFMISGCLIPITDGNPPNPRETGEVKPGWDTGAFWEYRIDDTELNPYVVFRLTYGDYISPGGPYNVQTEMTFTPTSNATQRKMTVVQVNVGAKEIKIMVQVTAWSNGTWATIVIDTGGSPAVSVGQTIDQGTFKNTQITTGEAYHNMNNLNFKRGSYSTSSSTEASGGTLSWTYDVNTVTTKSTSNGENTTFKPTWSNSPMMVGDTWTQENRVVEAVDTSFTCSGDITGTGSSTKTTTYDYDFNWLVASKASRTIHNTKKGGTTFPDAYKITRNGSYDWEIVINNGVSTGTTTTGPAEFWYACDGDNFDAGWYIETNGTDRLIYSSLVCFLNTPPAFTSPPADTISIFEDVQWNFQNGIDYSVTDPDPGDAGRLTFDIRKSLNGDTQVLQDLIIDPDTGDISYTPTQSNVADGYQITINVTDNYDKGRLGVEASFILNIKNTNDQPYITGNHTTDATIIEGGKWTPSWTLTDVFKDPDMDPNPLMGNQPYDPNERLTFTASTNSSIELLCPNGQELSGSNQCHQLTFEADDMAFPKDKIILVMINATDNQQAQARSIFNMTVRHQNHVPVSDGLGDITIDAGDNYTFDLSKYFMDIDVGNPGYVTGDKLSFSSKSSLNITVELTDTLVKLMPAADWCGEETISLIAKDLASATAVKVIKVKVQNCGPRYILNSWSPSDEATLQEGGTSLTQFPGQMMFNVDITERNGPFTYIWVVNVLENGMTLSSSSHFTNFNFLTDYDCNYSKWYFCGNGGHQDYRISLNVTNGVREVPVRTWNVTVMNTDRPPAVNGTDVYLIMENGKKVRIPNNPAATYVLEPLSVYELDATDYISDIDEGIGGGNVLQHPGVLMIHWTTKETIDEVSGPTILLGAGKKTTGAIRLTPGEVYHLSIHVTDKEGASAEYNVTIKVQAAKDTTAVMENFNILPWLILIVTVVVVIVYRAKKGY